jgi:hypothetical protein
MTEENQQAEKNDTDDQSKISKFTVNLSRGLQRRIRLAASQNDLSISAYVERVLNEAVPEEPDAICQQKRHYLTHEILQAALEIRKQIIEHTNGEIFEDSTELIRQMREERSRELEQL